MQLPHISQLNKLNDNNFKKVVCLLFELAPPLERKLLPLRPFTSYEDLIIKGRNSLNDMTLEERKEILLGHPAIGQKKLSGFSKIEQGNEEPEEVYIKLAQQNKEYLDYYGFPFIIFVNGRKKSEISKILGNILDKKQDISSDSELKRALEDLFLIAEDRLQKSTIDTQSSL